MLFHHLVFVSVDFATGTLKWHKVYNKIWL